MPTFVTVRGIYMSAQHKPALHRVEVLQHTQQTVVVVGNQKRESCASLVEKLNF